MTYTKLRRWLRSYTLPCEAAIYVPLPSCVSGTGDLPSLRTHGQAGVFRLAMICRVAEAGSPAAPLLKGTERWVPRRRRR